MLLQRIVVGPIEAIREHTERIAEHGLHASQLSVAKNDEIGEPKHISARLSNTTYVPLEMLSWAERSSALWFLRVPAGFQVLSALGLSGRSRR